MELGPSARRQLLHGYPNFADSISKDKDAAIYRKFESLSARNLLYQQSGIHDLEGQLEKSDGEDARDIDHEIAQQAARHWTHYYSDQSDQARLRRELQSKIKTKLKEYRSYCSPMRKGLHRRLIAARQMKR